MVGLQKMDGELVGGKKVSEELLFRTQQGTKDTPSCEFFVHAQAKRSVGTSGFLEVSSRSSNFGSLDELLDWITLELRSSIMYDVMAPGGRPTSTSGAYRSTTAAD